MAIFIVTQTAQENDNMLYELFKYVQKQFGVPKLINFSNITWQYDHGDNDNAVCTGLSKVIDNGVIR